MYKSLLLSPVQEAAVAIGGTFRWVFDRNDVDPASVEDVFLGCVDALGPQAGDIARTSWLAAGLPEERT